MMRVGAEKFDWSNFDFDDSSPTSANGNSGVALIRSPLRKSGAPPISRPVPCPPLGRTYENLMCSDPGARPAGEPGRPAAVRCRGRQSDHERVSPPDHDLSEEPGAGVRFDSR